MGQLVITQTVLNSTIRRAISGDSDNGITFTVTNNTAKPFLLQSRVIPWQADEQDNVSGNQSGGVPFIVLPPLQRLEASDALDARIR